MGRRVCAVTAFLNLALAMLPVATGAPAPDCRKFIPRLTASQSGEHDEARKAEVMMVDDKATADNPLTIEYQHSVGLDPGYSYDVIVPEAVFFNFQIASRRPRANLNLRAEWPAPSPNDIELMLYDERGREIAYSASLNPAAHVHRPLFASNDDGDGWEQIADVPVARCRGYTVESQGGITVPVNVVLSVWLS